MNFKGTVRILQKADDKIYMLEKVILCSLVIAMASLAFFIVVFRIVFHKCFVGGEDIVQNMILWCTFLGGAIGARSNRHLSINILQTYLRKGKFKFGVDILLLAVTCIVAGFLAFSGYSFVLSVMNYGENLPSLGMKLWVFQVIMPYTFLIVCFRYFLGTLKKASGVEDNSTAKNDNLKEGVGV